MREERWGASSRCAEPPRSNRARLQDLYDTIIRLYRSPEALLTLTGGELREPRVCGIAEVGVWWDTLKMHSYVLVYGFNGCWGFIVKPMGCNFKSSC